MTRAYTEIGGPFELVNQDGETVTQADYEGRHTMVFFGFTYCPDVCPMTLVALNQAYAQLPPGVEAPHTLLVSVDPERDTPETLAQYISSDVFPADISAVTGTPEQVSAAASAFKAGFQRVDMPESTAGYTMDHTSLIYLMDEDWQLATFFTHGEDPQRIASCLAQHMR